MQETTWSELRVRELLQQEDFAHQNIELPYGLATGGGDRSYTARVALPDDLTGKSVLDIGCKFGFFCFEAVRRGAKRVVGMDVDPDSVRKARLLADCLGFDVQFETSDFESTAIDESFDVVLCLNVLHHMRNPLAVLDRMAALTRERLVLEAASLGGHDRRKLKLSRFASWGLRRAPVLYINRSDTSGKHSAPQFFLTPGAVENLLRHNRRTFARVDLQPSEYKDRFLAIAHRRRIGRLVVVAGPTAAGKSTLIARLQRGEENAIAARVGITDGSIWPHAGPQQLATMLDPQLPRLLFHYDTLRPYGRSAKVHARDESLDVIDCADDITTLTLWCTPEQLRRQLERGEAARKEGKEVQWGRKRHRKLERVYADPDHVREHYRQWFAHLRTLPGRHWVVAVDGEVRLRPLDDWEEPAAVSEDGGALPS